MLRASTPPSYSSEAPRRLRVMDGNHTENIFLSVDNVQQLTVLQQI